MVLNQEETPPTPRAMRARSRRQRRSAGRQRIDGRMTAVDAPVHGEHSTYNNWACRCAECTTAYSTAENLKRRARWNRSARNGGIAPGAVAHGRSATYFNWGCQCSACLSAACALRAKRRTGDTT